MATSGGDSVLDSRYTCSICLEPFKGRHPKILTCFHTFCLPCLTQLTDRGAGRSLQTSRDDQVDKDGGSPVRIICPTCRSPTSIPPGGVKYLQKNFYLENVEEEAKNQPPTFFCDLCEEGQTAEYTCGQCQSYFCPRCSCIHDKLCKSSAVTRILTASKTAGERKSTEKAVDVEELIGKILKKLSEEEKRLGQERRAREHDIHVRYAILLRHAGEARDVSLASLRDVTKALGDVIENDATLAQEKLKRVKQLKGVDRSVSSLAEVLTKNDLRHFEDMLKTTEEEALLTYLPRDEGEESFLAAMGEFMGSVVPTRQNADVAQISETTASGQVEPVSQSTASQKQATNDLPQQGNGNFPQDLPAKVNEMAAKLELLSEKMVQSDKFCRDLAAVHDKNAKLCADVGALQKEVTSLQQGHASVRDKNSLLCQENTQLRDDVTAVKADHDKLQTDVSTVTADHSKLQSGHDKLQTDVSKITADQSKLQTYVSKMTAGQSKLQTDVSKMTAGQSKLQTDVSNMTAGQNKLQTDVSKMTAGQSKLQTDVSKMTAGQSKLQTDVSNMTAGQNKLQTDVSKITAGQSKLQKEHTHLGTEVGTLKKDVGLSRKENDKFGKELKNAQDMLRQKSTARSVLETKMGKVGVQVAFNCALTKTVTTVGQETLICEDVIFSVGGGYDNQTGIFTAPVSGLYCFMATSSPCDDDVRKAAFLWIVLENKDIAFLSAFGKGKCTAHGAVQVNAGQQVWLKTLGVRQYTFNGASTFFTGMLVQAEL
ncbi:paramyosin-like isoform X2 [Littorina saxatilis]|uniref:paramyosin-like isoform X2 n=1 Tax=Littorina saxatilis TaxID=31220 RepID=UPI0038B631BB